jgi:hypothetical protein
MYALAHNAVVTPPMTIESVKEQARSMAANIRKIYDWIRRGM